MLSSCEGCSAAQQATIAEISKRRAMLRSLWKLDAEVWRKKTQPTKRSEGELQFLVVDSRTALVGVRVRGKCESERSARCGSALD